MKKKHIVVGGGVAGIVTAYYLMQKGYSVILLEAEEKIGGLLASKEINGRYYDYGTHILTETGIKKLDAFLFDELECHYFKHIKVGSFNNTLYEGNGFLNDFSLLPSMREEIMDTFIALPRSDELTHNNLKEQLISDYGALAYEKLLEPTLKKFFHVDPQDLAIGTQGLFGLSRIMLGNAEITRTLKANQIFDRLLAYHSYEDGTQHCSFYPKSRGVGAWIDLLQSKLIKGGVEIITKAEFDLRFENGHIQQALINGLIYAVDRLYWTVPAVLLYDKLKLKKRPSLPPKRLTSVVVDVEVEGNYTTDVFYVQNFDPSMQSFRVTLYNNYNEHGNDSTKQLSVEFLIDHNSCSDASFYGSKAMLEIKQMGLIESNALMRVVRCDFVKGGFPIPTHNFSAIMKEQSEGLSNVTNLTLFGKATGRTWFMADVIQEIHQHFENEDNIQS
jgi:protoporphyrinogen oxidase